MSESEDLPPTPMEQLKLTDFLEAAKANTTDEEADRFAKELVESGTFDNLRVAVRRQVWEHFREHPPKGGPSGLELYRTLGKFTSVILRYEKVRRVLGRETAQFFKAAALLSVEMSALAEGTASTDLPADEYSRRVRTALGDRELVAQVSQVILASYTDSLTSGIIARAEQSREQDTTPEEAEPTDPMPKAIRQSTFPEVKEMAISLADGPGLRNWFEVEGETAWRHKRKGAKLETKLGWTPTLAWMGVPNNLDALQAELRRAGIPATLLLLVCMGAALGNRFYVTHSLDDLLERIGWGPRSRQERQKMRVQIWKWLCIFTSMQVVGKRVGIWKDPDTRKVRDTDIREPLLVLGGREDPTQLAFDGSAPPLRVTFAVGPFLDRFRGDRRMLQDFGDVQKIAAIPAGRPSGAWAQAIGLALHQLWRERSAGAELNRVGESKAITPVYRPFTRRELLSLFPPEPTVEEVLAGSHPREAWRFWDGAISKLKQERVIGHYAELSERPTQRQGWAADFLAQQIDIRPGPDGRRDTTEIARRALAVRRKVKQRRQGA